MEKVSVIMATYNCKHHVEDAIDSILLQSYTDIELIICDDHSTDGTWELIQQYKNNKKIKMYKNKQNMHAAYTRNKCIKQSTGEYIAIQDADDISEKDRIANLVNFLRGHQYYDFVGSSVKVFNDKNNKQIIKYKPERPEKKDFLFTIPFAHPSLLFRKEVLEDIGGYRVSKETTRVEDYDMVMRAYIAGYKGYNLEMPLYNYRVDDETLKKRKFKYRVDESKVRFIRFREMGLLPAGFIYVLKPIIVGAIPNNMIKKIKYKE